MKRIIEKFTKSQEKNIDKHVVNIDEETKTNEEPIVAVMRRIVKSVHDRVKDKNKQFISLLRRQSKSLLKKSP